MGANGNVAVRQILTGLHLYDLDEKSFDTPFRVTAPVAVWPFTYAGRGEVADFAHHMMRAYHDIPFRKASRYSFLVIPRERADRAIAEPLSLTRSSTLIDDALTGKVPWETVFPREQVDYALKGLTSLNGVALEEHRAAWDQITPGYWQFCHYSEYGSGWDDCDRAPDKSGCTYGPRILWEPWT